MAYGYRPHEVGLDYGDVKQNVKVTIHTDTPDYIRFPAMIALGCQVWGFAPCHVDMRNNRTTVAGSFKRVLRRTPIAQRKFVRLLLKETLATIKELNLVPLPADSDTSQETWLRGSNYPEWRRQELLECWLESRGILTNKHFVLKCFVKDETYPEFKHARGIFSRHDVFKCAVGPIFSLIEKQVFNPTKENPYFIKKIPVQDRPQYIKDLLFVEGSKYVATDYTAYESHFTKEIMEHVEFVLYDYMTKNLPGHKEFMWLVKNVIGGKNLCQFKTFDFEVEATRMSGEMCTSLGNGFTNLVVMKAACRYLGSECIGVVEGDDGLFRIRGAIPTTELFEKFGFTIKMDIHDKIETASFCGIVFDPEDLVNVADPAQAVLNFGWAPSLYVNAKPARRLEILRAKSLSYLHQYAGCPVIQAIALYGLRVTKHIDMNRFMRKAKLNMWERDRMFAAIKHFESYEMIAQKVPNNTRHLVEEKFGMTIKEQISLENYFDSLTKLQPLFH